MDGCARTGAGCAVFVISRLGSVRLAALHSASPPCQLVLKQMLGTLSNVLETLIFLYCGWSALDKSLWG